MTKEEKIKEAWGLLYHKNKDVIDENGWNQKRVFHDSDLDHDNFNYDTVGHGVYISRPKSLKGIEDNNMWVKINSEDDLPKKDIDCFYLTNTPERYCNSGIQIHIGKYEHNKNLMSGQEKYFTIDNFIYCRFPHVTHYKTIEKPNPPLY